MRYQRTLGLQHMMNPFKNPNYLSQLRQGYFEPIPTLWANDPYSPLTRPGTGKFEDGAEERLYWILNNSQVDGNGPRSPVLKPGGLSAISAARTRIRTAKPIDSRYASDGDVFVSRVLSSFTSGLEAY